MTSALDLQEAVHGATPFELLESKLRPSQDHGATVPRTTLIDVLEGSAVPIAVLSAGPGWARRRCSPSGHPALNDHSHGYPSTSETTTRSSF